MRVPALSNYRSGQEIDIEDEDKVRTNRCLFETRCIRQYCRDEKKCDGFFDKGKICRFYVKKRLYCDIMKRGKYSVI